MDEKLINSLIKFFQLYQEHPFKYLSESDVKCGLYSELIKFYNDTFQMVVNNKKYLENKYQHVELSYVTTEYHYFYENNGISGYDSHDRIDIAIINAEKKIMFSDINKQCDNWFNSESFWIQPVKYGIEIKLSLYPNFGGIDNDLTKLKNYYYKYIDENKLVGLSLCFSVFNNDKKTKSLGYTEADLLNLKQLLHDEKELHSFIILPNIIYYR